MKVCRRETFNAAHRLFNPKFDDAKNQAVFGKCNNLNYHGHNYALLVCVDGPIDPETGYVIDLKILADIPTAENIAVVIWNKIRKRLDSSFEIELTLWETERNSVFYNGK